MRGLFTGLLLAGLALAGCKPATPIDNVEDPSAPQRHGRFSGVGIYGADHGWEHLAGAPRPTDKAVATTADDTTLIVTVDGATGEIRQCGNYSGHCIAMNPWHAKLAPRQAEPVSLTARQDATGNSVAVEALDDNELAPAGEPTKR
ncbi:MAG: hypothetical protein WC804_05895 [Sphingomonas sp.]|jgi:hypothetical protein|uniref:hypothetical protein n=1 Tax=Sphingomonas sp. TaxID=28214 RepID=UPI00356A3600